MIKEKTFDENDFDTEIKKVEASCDKGMFSPDDCTPAKDSNIKDEGNDLDDLYFADHLKDSDYLTISQGETAKE